jgi:hypothetical protein
MSIGDCRLVSDGDLIQVLMLQGRRAPPRARAIKAPSSGSPEGSVKKEYLKIVPVTT